MRAVAFAVALLVASSGKDVVAREVDPLLYSMRDDGRASGKLIDDHTASIFGVVQGGARSDVLSALVLYKAASLSAASGYERFAIVKSKVTTSYLNFLPIVKNARLTVIFLHTGETVASQDGQPVIYGNNLEATDRIKDIIALYHPAAH